MDTIKLGAIGFMLIGSCEKNTLEREEIVKQGLKLCFNMHTEFTFAG